ncbi:MAG TPA: amidohydrolase family protein [Chloroflexota bacterium]|nr:amidohydrolase family protein [Chloroflexota bacterium]
MEIVDAQIHEVQPPKPVDPALGKEVALLVGTEIAREAMDCVGVDAALVFASQPYMDACVARYPDRFAGALTFDYMAEDLEEQVRTYRDRPGMLAGRNLVANAATAELRPEFNEGKFERLWAYAEKYNLPLFFSTHGWASVMEPVAQKHPGLTMVIDHLGVSQSPVSPPRDDPWDRLPGLLGLAKYPNVHVKFSGAPVLSREPFPHKDVWPYLHQVVNAFTPARLLWGSDFTRLRWIPQYLGGGTAPRDQWRLYSDSVSYLRDTTELSQSDKEQIFGGTIRRVLRWPKAAS